MTVSLDEQIAAVERLRSTGRLLCPVEDAILASLRQLQARTTALEECVEEIESQISRIEADGYSSGPMEGIVQRARKALAGENGT